MKNINNYNVQELTRKDLNEINGGSLLVFLGGAALALIVIGWIRKSKNQ